MTSSVDAALAATPPGELGSGRAPSERALVRDARRGRPGALEALVTSQWPKAHRAAFLIVHDAGAAEDIAQEAILSAINSLHRFDWRRPLSPWVHRIVVNRSIDWLRVRHSRPESAMLVGTEAERQSAVTLESTELRGDIVEALETLDPRDRAIVVLRHVLDYRSSEIGELLGLPASTVRGRLSAARRVLRERIEAPTERAADEA